MKILTLEIKMRIQLIFRRTLSIWNVLNVCYFPNQKSFDIVQKTIKPLFNNWI
jgi:hypothetical protein